MAAKKNPPRSGPVERPSWNTQRIGGLMDGIFAIAATLLVFNLKVPVIAPDAPAGELGRQLLTQLPQFLSFGLSLLVLGVYWLAYTIILQLTARGDRLYHWAMLLFGFCVISTPFSANLIGLYPYRLESALIYGVNLIAMNLALYLNYWYVVKYKLINPQTPPGLLAGLKFRILSSLGLNTAGTLLAFLDSRVALTVYVLISLVYIFPGRLDKYFFTE
jgi:uncharacterized membrane protein